MDIRVRTDNGVLPLSAVSQGTGSVMCWIGTLQERMSDLGLANDDRALVLIDEIDAHMHPRWQQLFIDAFRKQFPKVQVIATSHSPLLVGSLKKEEIWLVGRFPLKSEIAGVANVAQTGESVEKVEGDGHFVVDEAKIEEEARYDGTWVLRTNTELPAADVALQFKRLWLVEQWFRSCKSLLETRPIYHHCDDTIRGHVFC